MNRIYLHPLLIRLWHWINALVVTVLLVTGVYMRAVGIPGLSPRSIVLIIHRYAGWAMTASFVVWLVYVLLSGYLVRHYGLGKGDVGGIFGQAKFYVWSIFRHEEDPFRPSVNGKFNPLQKLAYGFIMCIAAPVMALTGLLLDIPFTRQYILAWNVVKELNAVHLLGAYVFAFYLVVHVYMATLGRTPLSHIKAMITGYEEESKA